MNHECACTLYQECTCTMSRMYMYKAGQILVNKQLCV